MHTEIEIIVPPSYTDELIQDLQQLEGVISLTVARELSIKPPGDVFTVHALNREVDEVLRLADSARKHGQVSVSTSELTSMIDPEHERKVANDVDEALWEEVETDLRYTGQADDELLGPYGPGRGRSGHRLCSRVVIPGDLICGGFHHRPRV